ncbi:MAG TPA: cardiolipin synthase [Vicinamibacterales bacterium]|nr:cardiolipin synthase [Vicinamibacterales bacterium]
MDFGQIVANLTWYTAVTALIGVYALSVAVFLILENRSPQSTFAWLFLLFVFPFGGVVLYAMFGRGRHAFSRERFLTPLLQGTKLADRAASVIAQQPANLSRLADDHGSYARIATMLWASARAPLTLCNSLEILQNASEKYPCLLADIRAASRSIHLLYYEWASDPFTEEVGRLLAEKVKEGVQVRILYDPFGSFTMLSQRYVRALRRAGISMYPFSPLYRLHTLSYRSHRKIAVLDGRIGYSGGLNMTEKHLTGPKGFSGWRDTHARVVGEAVQILQGVFATMWNNTTGENLFDDQYFPEAATCADGVPIQVVSAGPDSRWEAIRQAYLAMIAIARRHIFLQSPFLIPDTSLAEAMKTAALAGLDVRLMIAPRGAEFSPAYRAGLTYAADMTRAGVKVLLYQGAYFHPKTVCVDSEVCSVGSGNIDIRSFSINYETNLVIYDQALTRELEADFRADEQQCVAFSAEEYRARNRGSRFLDSTLRLCSPVL